MIRLLTVLALSFALIGSAAAQQEVPCDGVIATIRKSQIIEGGTPQGFMEAAKEHEAWYRANGVTTNKIVIMPVMKRDRDTGVLASVPDQFLSFHVNPPQDAGLPRGDAAWEAYVAKYRTNSKILDDAIVCLPKDLLQ
ncbi:MAG: hypothetical protein HXY22_07820 [Alphaproteobacteria bacterium]|nr:hypothetical protein [Alphaproteobacteria bacterium]